MHNLRRFLSRYTLLKNTYHAAQTLSLKTLCSISPTLLYRLRFRLAWGRWPDLKNPKTFDEKLIWLNLYWRHPLKTECGDKYTLRNYVERKGLGHLLPKLFGVYETVEALDFDHLPIPCVVKCSHGCKCNLFFRNKGDIDVAAARRSLRKWMRTDYSRFSGELHYAGMKPRIICEEFLHDGTGNLPIDYKVFCFWGTPHCTMVAMQRDPNGTAKLAFYDLEWGKKLPYCVKELAAENEIPKPDAYDEMLAAARLLSASFPFVRVDFYSVNSRAKLGEMTFTPGGCVSSDYMSITAQQELGSRISKLPSELH